MTPLTNCARFCIKPHHKCETVLPVKKKETNYITLHFYIMLNVIDCPVFIDIKQTWHYKEQNKYNQKEVYFYALFLIIVSHFFAG